MLTRLRARIPTLLLLLLSTLLSLVAAEWLVGRRLAVKTSLAWKTMQPDSQVYLVWKANSEETRVSPWGAYHVRINGQGFRMEREVPRDPAPGEVRIVAVGDSYAFGAGVEVNESFVSLLEADLRYRVDERIRIVNAAVGGYNLGHDLLRLQRDGLPLRPRHFLVFYCHNDLSSNQDPSYVNPFTFSFQEGRAVALQRPTGTLRQRVVFNSGPYIWLRQRSYLLAAALQLVRSGYGSSLLLNPDMRGTDERSTEDAAKDQLASDELVRRLSAMARSQDVRLWLIFVPATAELGSDIPRFRRLSQRNAELAAELGFDWIDPTLELRRVWEARGKPPMALPDGHYNATAHLLYAKTVAALFEERLGRLYSGSSPRPSP